MTIKIIGFLSILFILFSSGQKKLKFLRTIATILFMTISLFLIYSILPESLFSKTKPCNGIFGFKLGEKAESDKLYEYYVEYGTGQRDYLAKEFKNFMNIRYVSVSLLKDGSIYQICGDGTIDDKSYFLKLRKTIEEHYQITPKETKEISKGSVLYKFPNKTMMIIENYGCTIVLTSPELMKKFNEETMKLSIDTSALE